MSDISGNIMFAAAHLHDGGIDIDVTKDGDARCKSTAIYGDREGFVGTGGEEHISDMSFCTEMGRMEKGEEWSVVARYDLEEHEPMGMHGVLEPVMGIALLYVALDKETEELLE